MTGAVVLLVLAAAAGYALGRADEHDVMALRHETVLAGVARVNAALQEQAAAGRRRLAEIASTPAPEPKVRRGVSAWPSAPQIAPLPAATPGTDRGWAA